MTTHETTQACPNDAQHPVRRLPARPPESITIPNHQGPPTIRALDVEPPPLWCDPCMMQL